MRRVTTILASLVLALTIFPQFAVPNGGGAPPERTGAPGDGTGTVGQSGTCHDAGCHNTFPLNSGPGSVIINAPATYAPGMPVQISVTVSDPSANRFGFELTVKDANANHVGELVPGTGSKYTVASQSYVTHMLAGANNEWTVTWNPPPTDAGTVTIYAAGNGADGLFNSSNDQIYTASHLMAPSTGTGVEDAGESLRFFSVYPNPASEIITVDITAATPGSVVLSLIDAAGRSVETQVAFSDGARPIRRVLDVRGVAAGTYLFVVRRGNTQTTRTLTVVR